jgi:hypothetical protein
MAEDLAAERRHVRLLQRENRQLRAEVDRLRRAAEDGEVSYHRREADRTTAVA